MNLLTEYLEIIMLTVLIAVVLLFLLVLVQSIRISKLKRRINAMLGTSGDVHIEDAMMDVQQSLQEQHNEQQQLRQSFAQMSDKMKRMKARTAIVRYNAFQETGSDLSFSIAIVDEEGNGHVLTGIHNRHDTQMYAKPLEKGQSKYSLSPEEIEAITQALQS